MTDELVMPEVQIIKDGLAAIFKALYEQTAADPGVMFEELTKGLAFTASLLGVSSESAKVTAGIIHDKFMDGATVDRTAGIKVYFSGESYDSTIGKAWTEVS